MPILFTRINESTKCQKKDENSSIIYQGQSLKTNKEACNVIPFMRNNHYIKFVDNLNRNMMSSFGILREMEIISKLNKIRAIPCYPILPFFIRIMLVDQSTQLTKTINLKTG